MTRRSSRRAPSSFGGLQIVSIVFVVGVIAAGLYVSSRVKQQEAAAEAPATPPEADPFADLPEEVPRALKGVQRAKEGEDPFGNLAGVTEDEVWQAALAMAKEAEDLITEATRASDAGDRALAKEKGAAAQELLRKAVETTRDWEEALAKERGWDDSQVKAVSRKRTGWNREIMALKKTAGI